jgi:hypothetical protein
MFTNILSRPPDQREVESVLPRLNAFDRLVLRLAVAALERAARAVDRDRIARAHAHAIEIERRATAAERVALLNLPPR